MDEEKTPSCSNSALVNYKFEPPICPTSLLFFIHQKKATHSPRLFPPPFIRGENSMYVPVGSTLRNLVERQGWNQSFQHTRIYSLFPRSSKVGEEIGQRSIWWQEKQVFYSA